MKKSSLLLPVLLVIGLSACMTSARPSDTEITLEESETDDVREGREIYGRPQTPRPRPPVDNERQKRESYGRPGRTFPRPRTDVPTTQTRQKREIYGRPGVSYPRPAGSGSNRPIRPVSPQETPIPAASENEIIGTRFGGDGEFGEPSIPNSAFLPWVSFNDYELPSSFFDTPTTLFNDFFYNHLYQNDQLWGAPSYIEQSSPDFVWYKNMCKRLGYNPWFSSNTPHLFSPNYEPAYGPPSDSYGPPSESYGPTSSRPTTTITTLVPHFTDFAPDIPTVTTRYTPPSTVRTTVRTMPPTTTRTTVRTTPPTTTRTTTRTTTTTTERPTTTLPPATSTELLPDEPDLDNLPPA